MTARGPLPGHASGVPRRIETPRCDGRPKGGPRRRHCPGDAVQWRERAPRPGAPQGSVTTEMDWTFALSSLATLIAIVDPIGATAIFLAFFGDRSPATQRRAARVTATTVLVTAVVAFLWGERILIFFGISMAALKVTGGLIIGSVGASMLRGTLAASSTAAGRPEDAARTDAAVAMVPLGVPIIGGAGHHQHGHRVLAPGRELATMGQPARRDRPQRRIPLPEPCGPPIACIGSSAVPVSTCSRG